MKKLIILTICIVVAVMAISQTRVIPPKETRDKSYIKAPAVFESTNLSQKFQDLKSKPKQYEAESIGNTYFDLQSNATMQNRMFVYPDGFIGGVWTLGFDFPSFMGDRGTGYNNFEDSEWEPWPIERIESDRCGWPSYAPWGSNGEIVVAHYSGATTGGLAFSKRETKGTGSWTEFNFNGPDGHDLLWPSMITSGTDHETIHLLGLTMPVANGGSTYMGQDGALVFSRSNNGGTSWEIENEILDGLGSAYYTGFDGDTYEFAYPRANTLAILIGNDWTDLILLKSTDNGNTWTKTIIWENPYPLFDAANPIVTDTFYCADGSHSVAIDNSGKVHVAFGINRTHSDGTGTYWFPLVDGVGYWNEDMPTFSNNLNALSPYGDQGTEIIEDYNLIGWMQDLNGNGELDILDDIGAYFVGASSMPQLVIDESNNIFLVYSSVTEGYYGGMTNQNYRHLWARGSNNNGLSWGGFHDLNSDLIYIFDECVFPSCSPTSDENIYFLYQRDNEPGMSVRGDEDPFDENQIHYYSIDKTDIIDPNTGNMLTGMISEFYGGDPISGANITIEGTAFSATSLTNGTYTIYGIPEGTYTVICSKPSYIDESAIVDITNTNATIQNFALNQIVPSEETSIGETMYDLQSNYSMQNRIYKYDDGTIGGVWTMGLDFPGFPDRGTGYNYYNGLEWGAWPVERIESIRTGWPSYMPFGENGELVVSHDFGAGSLYFLSREEKGEGDWSEQEFLGPTSNNIAWNRSITSGSEFNTVHVLALTWPVSNGGSTYQGLDGALLYSRSTDGGTSWEQENVVLDGMTSSDYYGFSADIYEWAAKENQVAFLVGSWWTDLFLMKSDDNGSTWTKSIVWEHPYPLFDTQNPIVTDTFYCPDGSHSITIDNSGKVHIAFGISRAQSDGMGTFWFPLVDGVGYWNEDMPAFSNDVNALNPYGGTGSEVIQNYNLIGWSQDIDGNGELDLLDDWGEYFLGLSSMPQLVIDEENNIYLVYSSVTEGYDNAIQNYRHIWARGFNSNTQTWGEFLDLNEDLSFVFSECVFPSCSPTVDDQIHLLFMEDDEPGLAVRGDEDPYGMNQMIYTNVLKADLVPELEIGSLIGSVTESSNGNPISNAHISIQGTSFDTYSSADGYYEIIDIPYGTYAIHCQKSGYVNESAVVEIIGNNTTIQNFQMEEPSPIPDEAVIGNTWYDLQSNSSMQNRIYLYDDGSIAGVWTMGFDMPAFPDRGTGYNYYDGTNWDPFPTEAIETERTGWPSYAPWGQNGEIVVAHYSGAETDGLVINSRQYKGTGEWSDIEFYGPESNYYLWPRAMTGGIDIADLHILALTAPIANGGNLYQGMDGALLYSRSPDGGVTWDHQDMLIDEINNDFYNGFSGDTYEILTQGNNVAFLVGNSWTDLVLMKSSDNGDTWTKTVIWTHPYPMFDPGNPIVTDTFYNVDGAHSLAFDQSGKIHVAFGINRALSDGAGTSWFPEVGGIGYWNEDRPGFSNDLNALSPYGHPDSELIEGYSLIGWSQDLNENGELDILDDWGTYYLGFSSMPQLAIDEMNNIFLVYSSVTEGYDNGIQNYRHLWARGSNSGGDSWGEFIHLTNSIIYVFSECVFPSLAPTTDNSLHFIFLEDPEPGMAVRGDEDPYGENYIKYMNVLKSDIISLVPGGFLDGNVTNVNSGFPIEGATINLTGTTYSATSEGDGSYLISYVPPGDYSAVCSKMGYLNASFDVTISSEMLTTQDFELEEAIEFEPPQNLSATVFEQNNVLLEWEPPVSVTPTGYHVYRDNVNIGYSLTTSYSDYLLLVGDYEYFVTAVYEVGESVASNIIDVTISEPLLPPIDLFSYVEDSDVLLLWEPPISGTPLGYNVYRNDEFLAYTTGDLYVDEDLNPGTYEYYVTAVYDEGESDPSNTVYVFLPELCYPPENVVATVVNITEVHVTWDPPALGSPIGYNIYRDGNIVGFSNATEIYFESVEPGTYVYYVTTACLDGESEPVFADPLAIALLPPENFAAEIFGSNIILTWDEPGQKSLLGYNVYHSFDNGDYSLFAYLTQTSCIYSDAEIGYHHFYVSSVYDAGESGSSDIVEVLITAVEEQVSKEITIHPNPAKDFVNIKADMNIESVKIYNHSGEVVGDVIVNNSFYKLDISQFATGIYFFQLTTENGIIAKRVIVE